MKAGINRKTSSKEQQITNPGPSHNARAYRTGNPSGIANKSTPQGRGGASTDHGRIEKQNQ